MFICLFGVHDTRVSSGNYCRPPRTTRRNCLPHACRQLLLQGLLNFDATLKDSNSQISLYTHFVIPIDPPSRNLSLLSKLVICLAKIWDGGKYLFL